MKSQIPMAKYQINPNDQDPIFQKNIFWNLKIKIWKLFGIWSLLLGVCCLVFAGCSQPLRTLMAVNSEQKAQHKVVQKQDALFQRMLADIQSDRLKEGQRRPQIVSRYGDPILTTYDDKQETLLYRSPVKFFNATKVYLDFNEDDILTKIRIERDPSTQTLDL